MNAPRFGVRPAHHVAPISLQQYFVTYSPAVFAIRLAGSYGRTTVACARASRWSSACFRANLSGGHRLCGGRSHRSKQPRAEALVGERELPAVGRGRWHDRQLATRRTEEHRAEGVLGVQRGAAEAQGFEQAGPVQRDGEVRTRQVHIEHRRFGYRAAAFGRRDSEGLGGRCLNAASQTTSWPLAGWEERNCRACRQELC